MKRYLYFVRMPLSIITIYLLFYLIFYFEILPPLSEIEKYLLLYYKEYGLYAVGFLSFIENLPAVNAYFPGSIAILTAMSITNGNPLLGFQTYLTIYFFAFISYNISFFIGKFFVSKDLKKNSTSNNKSLFLLFFSTFWHPHSASLTSLGVGSEGITYRKFLIYTIIVSFFWNSFWALLMYHVDISILETNGNLINILIALYLLIWLLYKSYIYYKKNKNGI